MGFHNYSMDNLPVARLKHEAEMIAATSVCQIIGDGLVDVDSYEESSGESYCASYQINI